MRRLVLAGDKDLDFFRPVDGGAVCRTFLAVKLDCIDGPAVYAGLNVCRRCVDKHPHRHNARVQLLPQGQRLFFGYAAA